jgi:uncharacterized membrane protein YhhN
MSQKISNPIVFVFAIIALADLVVLSYLPQYRAFTKPLIMLVLLGYFLIETQTIVNSKTKLLFASALVFAWLGDVFLIGESYFIYGLLSFLVMQVLYTLCFVKGQNYYGKREIIFGGILTIIVVAMNYFLSDHVGDMRIPVIVYTLAISLMSFVAYTRDFTGAGYWSVWIGTVFFLLSDSLLSLNLFRGPITGFNIAVMATYIIAQWLIVRGYIDYLRGTESK